MGKNEKEWKDIPSLDGLEIDWDFEPENPMGKRSYVRLTSKELHSLFQKVDIPVRIATNKRQLKGLLLDVSQGGLSIKTDMKKLEVAQYVKVGFFLGKKRIISKAIIRNIRKDTDGNNILGLEFIDLLEDSSRFIASLYSSAKIKV